MSRNVKRCKWCENDPLYIKYHDTEWGVPIYDDQKIFEFLLLETFQAGLSWITILKKRESFRIAFDNFDYKKITSYSEEKMKKLKSDSGIIRNQLKIKAAQKNKFDIFAFIKVQKEFGTLVKYLWSFIDYKPIQNHFKRINEIPTNTPLSGEISKDLKKEDLSLSDLPLYMHICNSDFNGNGK